MTGIPCRTWHRSAGADSRPARARECRHKGYPYTRMVTSSNEDEPTPNLTQLELILSATPVSGTYKTHTVAKNGASSLFGPWGHTALVLTTTMMPAPLPLLASPLAAPATPAPPSVCPPRRWRPLHDDHVRCHTAPSHVQMLQNARDDRRRDIVENVLLGVGPHHRPPVGTPSFTPIVVPDHTLFFSPESPLDLN